MTARRSVNHLIKHLNHFLLIEQAFAHQVLSQQRKKLGAAMTFQVLEFGQGVVHLARRAQADYAVRVLCGHEVVLVVINLLFADRPKLADLT